MGNYHTPVRYHSAKICGKPIPFIFLQPTSKPWIIFFPLWSPFSLSSSRPQCKLKRVLVPTLQPETRRSGFQNTSKPRLTTKSDGEEWPWRPLRKKKKIKESGDLQGKSNVKCPQNCISSGPGGRRRATANPCRSAGSYAAPWQWGMAPMAYTLAGSPESCWWGRNAPKSLCAHTVPVAPGRAGVTTLPALLTISQCPAPWPHEWQQPGRACVLQMDKAHSVYRFFPCGCKIKEWERNLGCISLPVVHPLCPALQIVQNVVIFTPEGKQAWGRSRTDYNIIQFTGRGIFERGFFFFFWLAAKNK